MDIETAQVSRIGDRSSNQDKAEIVAAESAVLLTLADGMGGHLGGGEAADAAVARIVQAFKEQNGRIDDAENFLTEAVESAHQAVVALGVDIGIEARPRTTLTVCLIVNARAYWAHVGDSRIYLLRGGRVQARTRDHSAVEALYQEGLIERAQMPTHPWRNYVEECLGGEPERPAIEVGEEIVLLPNDIVLLCSDGFWAPLEATAWAVALCKARDLSSELQGLAEQAERISRPASDNATAAALRLKKHENRLRGPTEDAM